MVKLVDATLLIVSLFGICEVPAQAPSAKKSPSARKQVPSAREDAAVRDRAFSLDSINNVLWWLPEDTQTVSVARGPFKAVAATEPPDDMPAIEKISLVLRMSSLKGLQTIKKGRFYKSFVGRSVLFTVEGSRRFRPPTELGDMLYEGCDITILQNGLGSARGALLRQMAAQAKQVQSMAGQQVMLFEEKLEADIWKIFICIPKPDVVLCATNLDFLNQVLGRMQKRGQKRALPDTLAEWKHVDIEARFWAVRHYDKDDAQEDPSSPLNGNEDTANIRDTEAVGIVFYFDPSRSKVAMVKQLTNNKDAAKLLARQRLPMHLGFKPVIRLAEPGVIEMVVPLDDPEEGSMFLFVLLGLLGHGTYL